MDKSNSREFMHEEILICLTNIINEIDRNPIIIEKMRVWVKEIENNQL